MVVFYKERWKQKSDIFFKNFQFIKVCVKNYKESCI